MSTKVHNKQTCELQVRILHTIISFLFILTSVFISIIFMGLNFDGNPNTFLVLFVIRSSIIFMCHLRWFVVDNSPLCKGTLCWNIAPMYLVVVSFCNLQRCQSLTLRHLTSDINGEYQSYPHEPLWSPSSTVCR